MKFSRFLALSLSTLGAAALLSCSDKEKAGEEPEVPTTYRVTVNVTTNGFTRAEIQNENNIASLHLAFYTGETFNGIAEAEPSGDSFTCDVPEGIKPDGVIAFANLTDEQANSINGENIMTTTLSNFADVNDNMIMSSSRYFSADGKDMVKTPISTLNLIDSNRPVKIYLDRIASKVSVKNNTPTPSLEELNVISELGSINLNLKITKWGVSGSEQKSLLVKSYGGMSKNDIDSELDGYQNWNSTDNQISHWAHSATWDIADKQNINTNPQVSLLKYPNYSEIINEFGSSYFYHETTRPKTFYEIPNAITSIIIKGQYVDQNNNPYTFYHYNGNCYFDKALISTFIDQQDFLYLYDGKKVTSKTNEILTYFTLKQIQNIDGIPSNYVTLQLAEKSQSVSVFYDSEQKQFNDNTKLNELLAKAFGYAEKFENGKCYFIVPIRHKTYDSATNHLEVTGSYGLVRNHHYNIKINSITGLGCGIVSDTDIPLKYTYKGEGSQQYKVNATVSVNDWEDVSQSIDINTNEN